MEQWPPAKTVFNDDDRRGLAVDSIISHGAIISGSHVSRSVISPGVRINSFSEVEDSILMHGVEIGRHSRIKGAIIDKNVFVPENTEIGYNLKKDKKRFTVTPEGIVVIPKGYMF